MIVAIDGPAGSGKSTVARSVARTAGFLYVNSGNFYRAMTYAVLRADKNPSSDVDVIAVAGTTTVELRAGVLSVNGVNVEHELHTDAIDRWVAQHSSVPEVRAIVNARLRDSVRGLDAVVEGRDIATVVFPDASVKVFLDASIEERARRRFAQGISMLTLADLEKTIAERDKIDRAKAVGSLQVSPDALYLDTSHLTMQQVCDKVIEKIRKSS